uniref:Uncharacterized protein n=1 Tax=viral metagenome TaxID=1070528 RepID=A0A6C0KKT8_9ZZZZ
MSFLSAFTTQIVNFFEELCNTFPEEKDIKMAIEAIKGAKKINPRLILDLFTEHIYNDLAPAVAKRDIIRIREVAQQKISTQFNEMLSALAIFDKHWDSMGPNNQEIIWQYLKVLCVLSEKARTA